MRICDVSIEFELSVRRSDPKHKVHTYAGAWDKLNSFHTFPIGS